ncbi:hypothetical protein T492DRAFT_835394 [Pavlovales sp. CCMP2436]|nr:hypothetical protein T492DRAFT_835394 [Pavlovales sp. CCMP2436]
MANVFGQISSGSATFPITVPLVTNTTILTQLSLNSLTRDPDKALVTRIPATSPPANLALPFDPSQYGSPLVFVADLKLSNELATAEANSIGVQFALSQLSAITEGSTFTLGDTLKLQTESESNPQASTYTMNLRIPQTNVYYFRVFSWNSRDNPAQIISKWNNIMRPFIDGISFGHLALSYNSGTNASKDNLGLLRTPSPANPNWAVGMEPRPFANTAGFLQQGIKVGLFATGSDGATPRQMDFDITQYVANNSATSSEKYTMIINSSNEVSFFAGTTEITRDAEIDRSSAFADPKLQAEHKLARSFQ